MVVVFDTQLTNSQNYWKTKKKSAQTDGKSDLAGQLAQFTSRVYARIVCVRERNKKHFCKFCDIMML